MYSRASKRAAKAEPEHDRAEADYVHYQVRQQERAGQQAGWTYHDEPQPPGMLAVAGATVYLTPRHTPLAMSPAEARWLANEILNAAGAAERGVYG